MIAAALMMASHVIESWGCSSELSLDAGCTKPQGSSLSLLPMKRAYSLCRRR